MDDLKPDALGWASDPLVRLRTWDRCYPGNLNIEAMVNDAADEIERLRAAISGIAPWLSASLSDPYSGPPCNAYRAACEAVFAVDRES